MFKLEFREPSKVTSTRVNKEYWRHITKNNFERSQYVITRHGIVAVSELDWETNYGNDVFTYFEIIIDGSQYSAFFNKSNLNERSVKWLSSYFANKVANGTYREYL